MPATAHDRNRVKAPDTAGMTQACWHAASQTQAAMPDDRPLFQAMFSDRGASAGRAGCGRPVEAGRAPTIGASLDLFTDGPAQLRLARHVRGLNVLNAASKVMVNALLGVTR